MYPTLNITEKMDMMKVETPLKKATGIWLDHLMCHYLQVEEVDVKILINNSERFFNQVHTDLRWVFASQNHRYFQAKFITGIMNLELKEGIASYQFMEIEPGQIKYNYVNLLTERPDQYSEEFDLRKIL